MPALNTQMPPRA